MGNNRVYFVIYKMALLALLVGSFQNKLQHHEMSFKRCMLFYNNNGNGGPLGIISKGPFQRKILFANVFFFYYFFFLIISSAIEAFTDVNRATDHSQPTVQLGLLYKHKHCTRTRIRTQMPNSRTQFVALISVDCVILFYKQNHPECPFFFLFFLQLKLRYELHQRQIIVF